MYDLDATPAWRSRLEAEFRGVDVLAEEERLAWMTQAITARLRLFEVPVGDNPRIDIRGWVATTRLDDLLFALELDHSHRMQFSVAYCCPHCDYIGVPHQLNSRFQLGRALYTFKATSHACSDSKSRPSLAPIQLSDVMVNRLREQQEEIQAVGQG